MKYTHLFQANVRGLFTNDNARDATQRDYTRCLCLCLRDGPSNYKSFESNMSIIISRTYSQRKHTILRATTTLRPESCIERTDSAVKINEETII